MEIEPQCLGEIRDGLIMLAFEFPRNATARQGTGVLGINLEHSIVVGDGLVVLALSFPNNAPIVVGVQVVRLQPNGFAKVGDGPVVFASSDPHLAAIEVRSGTLRIEAKGPVEIGESHVVVAPMCKDEATTPIEVRPDSTYIIRAELTVGHSSYEEFQT
jgi:hypothetical protein